MENRPKTYPWRRRRRKLLLALSAVVILAVGGLSVLNWRNARRYEQQIAAIRASGFPASVKELEEWHPKPPPEENGAEVYQKAFEARKGAGGEESYKKNLSEKMREESKQSRFSEALHKLVEQHLSENAEVLRLLHEAAKRPATRFPVDLSKGLNMDLSHLSKLRDSVRLLQLEAFIAAEDGDANRAVEAILAALAVRDSVRFEPLVISQLVGFALDGIISATVSRALGMGAYSEEQLLALCTALQKAEDPRSMTCGLAGERANVLMAFEHPEQMVGSDKWVQQMEQALPGAAGLLAGLINLTGYTNWDRQRYLSLMSEMIQVSQLPTYEALPAMSALERRIQAERGWLPNMTDIVLPALARVEESVARDQANLRAAYAAVAVERYRLVYNRAPERLDDLVPSFLETVPVDPFDGHPLRFRLEENGYLVYSVGIDLRDNNGEPPGQDQGPRGLGDLVLRVER